MLRSKTIYKNILQCLCCSYKSIKTLIFSLIMLSLGAIPLLAQEKNIEVFPSAPYDRFIIYQALVLFWIGIIGLIVIIRMKLREIERIQDMGIDKEEKDIPFLD
ncbi:MAG TPA: hypothetical protein PK864_05130 [Syntrophorhabdaceae bacterium]|nr:hypothetical protein [Syntrophorhabdaceae bacterium]HPC67007.1 hypothetical protein [Syntrophorhabdaceae bacterium]HQE81106.1 hypothetical protein [Syntrophorhabdaceae bacterium]HQK46626.1 hypothetical protein [Syntrophorhabdaceae bacterium]HRR71904.1 hypothetical protein [Syntrophorhabdaceae bacterium]